MPETQENFRKEISSEVKLVLDMTARVDERVKVIAEKQSEMTSRLNTFIDSLNSLTARVSVVEASQRNNGIYEFKNKYESMLERVSKLEADDTNKDVESLHESFIGSQETIDDLLDKHVVFEKRIEKIEETQNSTWSKIKFVIDLFVKAGWTIIVAYLLFKLGLSKGPTP